MIRNNDYDEIRGAVRQLQQTKDICTELLKAEDVDFDKVQAYVTTNQQSRYLQQVVLDQFRILRADHYTSKINLAKYMDYLLPLKEYFDNPANADNGFQNKDEVLAEINKYF